MKAVRIIKDTFINGNLVKKGQEIEVDDMTVMLLGAKAEVISEVKKVEIPIEKVEKVEAVKQNPKVVIKIKGKGKKNAKR